jgi:CRP-like cAMP-binding protein
MAPGMRIHGLHKRELTHERGDMLTYVDFPIDAILSIVATFDSGEVCDVATVGREGFVESDAALESTSARRTSFCQVAGDVVRMPLDVFRQEMTSSASFATIVRRNVSARLYASEQSQACGSKHSLGERLALWLLRTRDRVGRDEFMLTHELLSIMLGVRRAGISTAAEALQRSGAIEYHRGRVVILDPDALAAAACECYVLSREEFTRSLRTDARG